MKEQKVAALVVIVNLTKEDLSAYKLLQLMNNVSVYLYKF